MLAIAAHPRYILSPMRNFGIILLLGGALGYFYCADQGWEAGRYACAVAGALGLLLAFFPKGR